MIYTKSIQNEMKNEIHEEKISFYSLSQSILEYNHLVQYNLSKLNVNKENFVLDALCDTEKRSIKWAEDIKTNFVVEINPFVFFASKLKTINNLGFENLKNHSRSIINSKMLFYKFKDIGEDLRASETLIKKNQVKTENIISLERSQTIENLKTQSFFTYSLVNQVIEKTGEIGFGLKGYRKKPKDDVEVTDCYLDNTTDRIQNFQSLSSCQSEITITLGDFLKISPQSRNNLLCKIDHVTTSSLYLNEKDASRNTILERILLYDLENGRCELRNLQKNLLKNHYIRIYSRGGDGDCVKFPYKIRKWPYEKEEEKTNLEKISNFEQLSHKNKWHYLEDICLSLRDLKLSFLRNSRLLYIVKNQITFLQTYVLTRRNSTVIKELAYKFLTSNFRRRDFQNYHSRRVATFQSNRRYIMILNQNHRITD